MMFKRRKLIAVTVLFCVMLALAANWNELQSTQEIGNGNRELLCDSIKLRLEAEAHNNPVLVDAYNRRCSGYEPLAP